MPQNIFAPIKNKKKEKSKVKKVIVKILESGFFVRFCAQQSYFCAEKDLFEGRLLLDNLKGGRKGGEDGV